MVLLVFKAQFQLTRNIFMDSSPGLRKIETRIKIPPPFFFNFATLKLIL